jgi:hypothetical protein
MLPLPAGREASPGGSAYHYACHRPERTFLSQIVEEYYLAFMLDLAAQGRHCDACTVCLRLRSKATKVL